MVLAIISGRKSKEKGEQNMKKKNIVSKVIMVLGFIAAVVGVYVSVFEQMGLNGDAGAFLATTLFGATGVAAILATTFIFSTNNVIKNAGYCLAVVLGVSGFAVMGMYLCVGAVVAGIGYLIMAASALVYYFVELLRLFGFVRKSEKCCEKAGSVLDELTSYKELQQEKVLTEEEFAELKQKLFENADTKVSSIDDLKKWKKLLDQQVITEDEYSKIKSKIFNA